MGQARLKPFQVELTPGVGTSNTRPQVTPSGVEGGTRKRAGSQNTFGKLCCCQNKIQLEKMHLVQQLQKFGLRGTVVQATHAYLGTEARVQDDILDLTVSQ